MHLLSIKVDFLHQILYKLQGSIIYFSTGSLCAVALIYCSLLLNSAGHTVLFKEDGHEEFGLVNHCGKKNSLIVLIHHSCGIRSRT